MISEELTAVRVLITIFLVVTPSNPVGGYQRFGGIPCFHLQGYNVSIAFSPIFQSGRGEKKKAEEAGQFNNNSVIYYYFVVSTFNLPITEVAQSSKNKSTKDKNTTK
jgi:hypothetical protein